MKKKSAIPASHKLMIPHFSFTGLVEGWYFRQCEVSAGCYVVEGFDVYGHRISRQTNGDPDKTLRECIEYARKLPQRG